VIAINRALSIKIDRMQNPNKIATCSTFMRAINASINLDTLSWPLLTTKLNSQSVSLLIRRAWNTPDLGSIL
jgi:hypothetical protein